MVAAAPELIELTPQSPVHTMDGDTRFTSNPDGTELVDLNGGTSALLNKQAQGQEEGFTENLAEKMTPSQRHTLAERLIEYRKIDLESRQNWDAMTKQALVLLGVDKVDVTRLPFAGAASMQHPVIAEACTQFNANAIEEFFPATGPVKGKLAGEATPETEAQVQRAEDFMNYYLTSEDEGYYADCDQMLFYLPIAGSVFRKAWIDPRNKMPRVRYIKADDFIAPYFARDLENCTRYCHQFQLSRADIDRAVVNGEFMDLNLPRPTTDASEDGLRMDDKSDRRTKVLHEDDEIFDFLEYHVEMSLPEGVDEHDNGSLALPYVVTVDRTNGETLACRRNWKENDQRFKKRIWFTHYKFLPGLGFYGWGFLHVIGSLAEAISGSIRVLLDSALMATMQGGFRAKDGIKGAGSIFIEPGKWKDVDATSEELNKSFYTPPWREPSTALPALIQALVQDARRFASLTEVVVGQADNKAPVGTTLALIEQSLKLFTAIHKRIFNAAQQEFRMLAELIHDFSEMEQYPYFLSGEQKLALRSDFDDRVDFIPVADPNIISDVQRISLAQAQLELVQSDPQLYGPEQRVEVHKRFLKALKVPNSEAIEPKLPTATYLDPIGENQLMLIGKPVRAYPGQRHDLHQAVHMNAVETAKNTLPPDQFEVVYNTMMSHVREHMALQMAEQVSAAMQQTHGVPLPPTDIYGENKDQPPQLEMAISISAAQHLPPIPPPQPGSAGAMQAQPGADAQAQEAELQHADAEHRAKLAATDADAQAKIQRDTAGFVAKQHQDRAAHTQKLTFAQQEHAQRMKEQDEEAAAKILREHAAAQVKRRHEAIAGASQLAITVRSEREKAKAKKAGAKKPAGKKH